MIGASRAVFVDTSAWFAWFDERDARQRVADRIFARLAADRTPLVTSNFVLAETHALTLRRVGRVRGLEVIDRMRRGSVLLIRITEEHEERAVEIIEQYADKPFSYTDATSFALMRRLGITTAFTFDRHFAQFGLTTIGLDA